MAAALPAVVDYASSDDEDSPAPASGAVAGTGSAVEEEGGPSASRMIRGAGAFVQSAPEPALSLAVSARTSEGVPGRPRQRARHACQGRGALLVLFGSGVSDENRVQVQTS